MIEDADKWRSECWQMIRERSDLHFLFLTKRIERFMDCIPEDWNEGYDNVTVGCTVENQDRVDYRLSIFNELPIKHKNIICQPLIEEINLTAYLDHVELVVVGGESDRNDRPLDYAWVLSIREQCIAHNVHFEFRQCGTHFIKDGKSYTLSTRDLCSQARIACCSAYHYQRMFTYMAGITLAEYIRRRKMSLAAVDLQSRDERIIDIAEKYGYRSPTAFNRAFQSFHGIAPSSVKDEG